MTIDRADAVGRVDAPGFLPTLLQSEPAWSGSRPTPTQFLRAGRVTPAQPGGRLTVEYTCPMHPEIVRGEPGACPICGMALEPRTVTLDDRNPELEDMTRRLWWSAAITAPILAFMVSELLPGQPLQRVAAARLAELGSARARNARSCLWGGWPFFVRGWASVVNRHLNMFTLIALGVGAAYTYSGVATLAPGLFPDSVRMMGEVAVYFEPAAVIVVLVLLGQVLELRARSRTSSAIRGSPRAGAEDGTPDRTGRRRAGRAARPRARR